MINKILLSIIAFLTTIIIGPLIFYLLSRFYLNKNQNIKKENIKKYPAGINDSFGDMLFLPFFNAILIYIIIQETCIRCIGKKFDFYLIIELIIAIIFVFIYAFFDLRMDYKDWSKPKKNKYNIGGYYHLFFMLIQSFLIIHSLQYVFIGYFILLIPLIGYSLTLYLQIKKEKHW